MSWRQMIKVLAHRDIGTELFLSPAASEARAYCNAPPSVRLSVRHV